MKPAKNHYSVLGVDRSSDQSSIKKAYRKAVKSLHPDLCGRTDSEEFRRVQEAYEVLGDEQTRGRYDRDLGGEAPRGPAAGAAVRPADAGGQEESFGWSRRRTEVERGIEIILSPWEAVQGGRLRVPLSETVPCPRCSGGWILDRLFCPLCRGSGVGRRRREAEIVIPPGIHSGSAVYFQVGTRVFEARIYVE